MDRNDRPRNHRREDDDDAPRSRRDRTTDDDDRPRSRHRDDDDNERPRSRKERANDDDNKRRSRPRDEDESTERTRARKDREDEDERPRSPRRDDNDSDERPRSRDRNDDDLEDEADDRPRRGKRKKKKKKSSYQNLYEELENPSRIRIEDWLSAGFLFGIGMILCLVASVGIVGSSYALKAMFVMFVFTVMLIPLSVGAMMGAGILCGINYGEWKVTIVKLAAISAFNNGLIWLGDWIGLPFYVTLGICTLILFGVFMALFDLDPNEAMITVGAINLIQFLARFLLISLALLKAKHEERKYERDYDDRPKHQRNIDDDWRGKQQMPPENDPDDNDPM